MHEIESLFSANGIKPWHGLGTIVNEAPNSQEALKLAGLDWEVEKRKIFIQRNYPDIRFDDIPDHYANVRITDNAVLGIVGEQYQIVQNKEAFDFVDSLVSLGDGKVKYETAGSLRGGKKVWLSTKLPSFKVMNDEMENYVCFTNSFDGCGSIRAMVTPIRVVCMNTLNMAINQATRTWSCVHKGDISNKLSVAKESLGLANTYVVKFIEEAETLQEKKINVENAVKLIIQDSPVDSDKQLARKQEDRLAIINLTKVDNIIKYGDDSAWVLLNAISDFAFHRIPRRQTDTYQEKMFDYILTGNTLLDRAYNIIRRI
jgi:phage/plasmid-like protein (TIGR03299 family)